MIYLRLYLLLGMVIHKLVWEILKRRKGAPQSESPKLEFNFKTLVKIVKTLILIFLIIQTAFLDVFPILDDPLALRIFGVLLYTAGLVLAIIARVQLGQNWANLEDFQVLRGQQLVQTGIYQYIRHPIYTGDFLFVLGLELALNSWLVLIVLPLAVVIYRQALAEEKLLSNEIPGYADYCRRSKMFIPYLL